MGTENSGPPGGREYTFCDEMRQGELSLIGIAMLTILLASIAAWRNWLPSGKLKSVLLFIAGALPIVLLFLANIPPKWFSGSAVGFGLGATMLASAFSGRTAEEKSFRVPFLSGFGIALLAVNVWPHIQ